jgi:DNA-nicking Smr family endonuclease
MADEKPKKASATKAKKAGAKKAKAKKPAAKKAAKAKPKKAGVEKAAKKPASKSGAKGGAKKGSSRPTAGLDKSIAQFRDSLEHSVTLSRDRIQEVVDDAVKRGRMTSGDAEKMLGELLKRGRKQTDALLGELEKLARAARRKLP